MKKLLVLISCSLLFISSLFAQPRIQQVNYGIKQLGYSKAQIERYLSNLDFHQTSHYNNFYDYEKQSPIGTFEYTISIRNNKVNVVSWLEHIIHLSAIRTELMELGFQSVSESGYTEILGFKNTRKNLTVTINIRRATNDMFISISALNPNKPVVGSSQASLSSSNGNIQLPDAREAIKSGHRTFTTKLTKEQILAYYKPLGAKNIYGNSFYMPFFESGSDSCILVRIVKKGTLNQLLFSLECGD